MNRLLLILILICVYIPLYATNGDFRLQIEVIEACGYGDSDSDEYEEYRWVFRIKEDTDTDWVREGRMGYDQAVPGSCFYYDQTYTNDHFGIYLPFTLWNQDYNYNQPLERQFNFDVGLIGFEKDCHMDDVPLYHDTGCSNDDDDLRLDDWPLQITIDKDHIPGEWYETSQLLDNKWSFKYRWRWSPPVPTVPTLPSGGVNNICSEEYITVETTDFDFDYTVQYYKWYQLAVESNTRTYVGTTTEPTITVQAPQVINSMKTLKYQVYAFGKDDLSSITGSSYSQEIYVYPEGPTITDYPNEIDNDYDLDAISKTLTFYTNISDTLSYGNLESIEILNVDCKDDYTGKIRIKKVQGSGKYYYNLKNLNTGQVLNINGNDLSNKGNPSEGGVIQNPEASKNPISPTGFAPIDPDPGTTLGPDYIIFPDDAGNKTTDGLKAGTYVLRIENLESPSDDSSGEEIRMCYRTYVIKVKEPKDYLGTSVTYSNNNGYAVSCNGGNDGQATISGSGGIGNYHFYLYRWDNLTTPIDEYSSTYKISHKFTGLSNLNTAGIDYKVIIEDELGCQSSIQNISISEPGILEILSPSKSNYNGFQISCNGGNDGEISVRARRGAGDYSYRLYKKNTSGVYISKDYKTVIDDETIATDNVTVVFPDDGVNNFLIGPGDYKIRVTDANGCFIEEENILLDDPEVLDINFDVVMHPLCIDGGTDGYVTISGSGGVSFSSNKYKFAKTEAELSAETSRLTKTLTGYTSGLHTVWIMDKNGCIFSEQIDIPINPNPLNVSEFGTPVPPSCSGHEDGSFQVQVNNAYGSTKNLTYRLFDQINDEIATYLNQTATSVSFSDIRDGYYSVLVVDNNTPEYCEFMFEYELQNRPDPLQLSVSSIQEPSCNGFSDGVITFIAEGGDQPYEFSFDNENYFNDELNDGIFEYSGIPANVSSGYTLYVRDANYTEVYPSSCDQSFNQLLTEPSFVTITETIKDVSCFNGNDGELNVIVTGGIPADGYSYEWVDLSNTSILGVNDYLTALSAGNYRVKVKNGTCPPKFESFTINEPSELKIQYIIPSTTSCQGRNDGFVTIGASGGTPPYQYTINGITKQVGFFTDLSIGSHQVELMDKLGCNVNKEFEIEDGKIEVQIEGSQNLNCYQSNDGVIKLSASGGSTPYTYSINGTDFYSNSEFINLSAQTYYLMAKDATGCTSDVTEFILNEPSELTINPIIDRHAYCDLSNGEIHVEVSGGIATTEGIYNITILDSNLQEVNPLELKAGTYEVMVSDDNSCAQSQSIVIDNLPPHSLSYEILSIPYCGLPIGSAEVTVSGGVGPFEYLWESTLETTAFSEVLNAGTHTVHVVDQYTGCVRFIDVTLTDGVPLAATQSVVNATCNQNNGDALISVSGGVSPYSYDWVGLTGDTNIQSDLYAGNYAVLITDAVGCTLNYTVIINNEDGPSIDGFSTNASWCGLPTGEASVTVSGGTTPYNYQWITTSPIQTSSTATNLIAGEHIVQITDATGCIVSQTILVTDDASLEPLIEVIDVTNSACGLSIGSATVQMSGGLPPYTYQWNDESATTSATATNLAAGVYHVIGTDNKGCQVSIDVLLNDNPDPNLSFVAKTSSACGLSLGTAEVLMSGGIEPYTYHWNDSENQTTSLAENLSAGTYEVYGEDGNGCTTNTLQVRITDRQSMRIDIVDINSISCHDSDDGDAIIEVINAAEPFTISWNDINKQDGLHLESVAAGTYEVTVIDNNGCSISTFVTIPSPEPISILNSIYNEPSCYSGCDGSLEVYVSGGVGGYTFIWSDGQMGNIATNLCAGIHEVQIQDTNGCSFATSFELSEPAKITETGIPEHEILCEGQTITLNPGPNWSGHVWESDNGFYSEQSSVNLSDPGNYYLSVFSENNCLVQDTFLLENRDDILEAQFLMATEAEVGDTIVIVEITWPEPDNITWEIPSEAREITSGSFFKEIVFDTDGAYTVGLNAAIGDCEDYYSKSIRIFGRGELRTNGRVASEELIKQFLIYPNPNDGYFTIGILLSNESNIELSIVSLQNGLIKSKYIGQNASEYNVEFDLPQLSKGVYLANLKAGNKEKNLRFVVK